LPWLVLLGRCCYYAGGSLMVVWEQQDASQRSRAAALDSNTAQALEGLCSNLLQVFPAQLGEFVGAPALVTAGYTLQPVQEQLLLLHKVVHDRLAWLGDIGAAGAGTDAAQGLSDLAQQLRTFGVAASSIPVPDFCNNPDCVTARGQSEAELVSGRSCMCGKCRVTRYCSRDCQRAQWAHHKPACKALAAVAVAAAGDD
jgi:hypothetical protein